MTGPAPGGGPGRVAGHALAEAPGRADSAAAGHHQPLPSAAVVARRRWRAARGPLLLAGALVLVVVAGVAVIGPVRAGDLDPDSPAPEGSRAVAQVLGQRGVVVTRHERVDPAVRDAGPGTTLLVVRPQVLGAEQLRSVHRSGADLVLVEPTGDALDVLAPDLELGGDQPPRVADAECDEQDAQVAGRTSAGGQVVRARGHQPVVCFRGSGDQDAERAGSYAVTVVDGHLVRVIAQPDVLRNGTLTAHGNAALALRALGEHPRLVWLMAGPLDGGDRPPPTLSELLPPWVGPVALQLLLVGLVLALWRGRRLGPLVAEPLPVVVRSAETAEGRATLYRAGGAHDHAGQVLRAAAARRLARRLGLPASAPAADVVAAVSAAVGRPAQEVAGVLTGPPADSPAALVALTERLDRLEAEVAGRPGVVRGAVLGADPDTGPGADPDTHPGVDTGALPGAGPRQDAATHHLPHHPHHPHDLPGTVESEDQ
ncbi:DUF4350 domain-containing protein [Thalassiella azotivora]